VIEAHFFSLIVALIIDAVIGEPQKIWSRIPHPIVVIGHGIDWLDLNLNSDETLPPGKQVAGVIAIVAVVIVSWSIGYLIELIIDIAPGTTLLEAVVVAVFIAGRGLYDHVLDVAVAIEVGGLEGGRRAVSHIVGRDPGTLDERGVCRAAIESAAENFSDGVVAPAFWYVVFGLPGLFAYKAINTADSMIGYRSRKYLDFGMGAARLDDLVNWIPARMSALLILVGTMFARFDAGGALRAMSEDASKHRSVNAGWPEATFAGSLGIALAGPRQYGATEIDDAWMNRAGSVTADTGDIRRALKLLMWASIAHALFYALLALIF